MVTTVKLTVAGFYSNILKILTAFSTNRKNNMFIHVSPSTKVKHSLGCSSSTQPADDKLSLLDNNKKAKNKAQWTLEISRVG